MDYDVTKSSMEEVFEVPAAVADKYLKLANPTHLIILLWMLRVGLPMSSERVANELHIDKSTVGEAMFYWIECGILIPCSGDKPNGASPEYKADLSKLKGTPEPEKTAPKKVKTAVSTPLSGVIADADDLVKRAQESEGFNFLLNESQKVFGRTISRAEQSMLLSLTDNFGLPPEVILMLIKYCVSAGKKGTAYIQKTGEGWAEEGITTLEQAERKIHSLKAVNKLWTELASRIGNSNPRPTKKQEEYLNTWSQVWHFDIDTIHFAYEEMANRCSRPNFKYVDKILENWYSKGITTLKQAKSFCESENNSTAKSDTGTSYDIDKVEQKIRQTKLVYTGRN